MIGWFQNLRIGTKLLTTTGVVLALTAALGIFSVSQLGDRNSARVEIASGWRPKVQALGNISAAINHHRRAANRSVLLANKEDVAAGSKDMEDAESALSFFKVDGGGRAPVARETTNPKPRKVLALAMPSKSLLSRQAPPPKQASKGIALHVNGDGEDASFQPFSGTEAKS